MDPSGFLGTLQQSELTPGEMSSLGSGWCLLMRQAGYILCALPALSPPFSVLLWAPESHL